MIYRVDLHVHTSATAGTAATLDELVRAARRAGLDAIAVTDRDCCTPVPIELRGVLLIPGCEVTTLGGQILGVFLDRPFDLARLRTGGLPTADEAVLEIHRCGGLAILAHPFAKKDANPALFPLRPDAVETFCARASLQCSDANRRAALWAANHHCPRVGSSNAHSAQELGNGYTEIACPRLTRAFLKEALDLGYCRAIGVRDTDNTACGYADLANAKRQGIKKQIIKSTLALGMCKLMDLSCRHAKKKQRLTAQKHKKR